MYGTRPAPGFTPRWTLSRTSPHQRPRVSRRQPTRSPSTVASMSQPSANSTPAVAGTANTTERSTRTGTGGRRSLSSPGSDGGWAWTLSNMWSSMADVCLDSTHVHRGRGSADGEHDSAPRHLNKATRGASSSDPPRRLYPVSRCPAVRAWRASSRLTRSASSRSAASCVRGSGTAISRLASLASISSCSASREWSR